MSKDKIPHGQGYEEIADFWDPHSLAEYWDQTEPAALETTAPERDRGQEEDSCRSAIRS